MAYQGASRAFLLENPENFEISLTEGKNLPLCLWAKGPLTIKLHTHNPIRARNIARGCRCSREQSVSVDEVGSLNVIFTRRNIRSTQTINVILCLLLSLKFITTLCHVSLFLCYKSNIDDSSAIARVIFWIVFVGQDKWTFRWPIMLLKLSNWCRRRESNSLRGNLQFPALPVSYNGIFIGGDERSRTF